MSENNLDRELIGSVEMDKTKGGKPVVNLYSTDTRLQYPVLRLFDLSALHVVGIDPDDLGTERVHRRFWAYYSESDKQTSQGTRYRDVEYLEPIDTGSAPATDMAPVLAELRAIRGLLQILVDRPNAAPGSQPAGNEQRGTPPPADDEEEESLDAFFGTRPGDWTPEASDEPTLAGDELAPAGNGNGTPPPTAPQDLVLYLKEEMGKEYAGAGELFHVLRSALGDAFPTWPKASDIDGWQRVTEAASRL